jgi:hypothetical protein
VLAGWVVEQGKKNLPVTQQSYAAEAKKLFDVEMSYQTCGNYLRQSGFSWQKMGSAKGGYKMSKDVQATLAWEWVQDMRRQGVFKFPPSQICSVDFTFTSHRTDSERTFAPIGGGRPISSSKIGRYTNCIVTCLWADGVNRTPPMMFTFNPAFRIDRKSKLKRDQRSKFFALAKELKIDRKRIVYVGKKMYEKRTFVRECPELLELFFKKYRVRDCVVLSDNGNSIKTDSLTAVGITKHLRFPAAVHQFLSPNDNHLHGSSKMRWRGLSLDFNDDVTASLQLLRVLDEETVKHGRSWWQRNLLLVTEESMRERVNWRPTNNDKYFKRCLREFRIYNGEDPRGPQDHIPKELRDGLDGEWYQ